MLSFLQFVKEYRETTIERLSVLIGADRETPERAKKKKQKIWRMESSLRVRLTLQQIFSGVMRPTFHSTAMTTSQNH